MLLSEGRVRSKNVTSVASAAKKNVPDSLVPNACEWKAYQFVAFAYLSFVLATVGALCRSRVPTLAVRKVPGEPVT